MSQENTIEMFMDLLFNPIDYTKCQYYNNQWSCARCKLVVYNPGPNYLEDREANAQRGCLLAQQQQEMDFQQELDYEYGLDLGEDLD